MAPEYGLDAMRNPEKDRDKMALDLVVNGILSELKHQKNPFFNAPGGIPVEWAFSVNRTDVLRYGRFYPKAVVYLWFRWEGDKRLRRLDILSRTKAAVLYRLALFDEAPHYNYPQKHCQVRGNREGSHVYDLRRFEQLERKEDE